jgi:hypothetical protein
MKVFGRPRDDAPDEVLETDMTSSIGCIPAQRVVSVSGCIDVNVGILGVSGAPAVAHASDPLGVCECRAAFRFGQCRWVLLVCLARRLSQLGKREAWVRRSITCNSDFTFVPR